MDDALRTTVVSDLRHIATTVDNLASGVEVALRMPGGDPALRRRLARSAADDRRLAEETRKIAAMVGALP